MTANEKLRVMEIYGACQGEGQFIGQRVVFIRLFGCNFRCDWCDTAYSISQKEWWEAAITDNEPPYAEYTVEELMNEVLALTHPSKSFGIVITGGEPTLHQDTLTTLLQELHREGYNVTVETNGTIVPQGLPEWYGQTWDKDSLLWSISPKLPSAGDRTWIDFEVLQWYIAQTNAQLKFVVRTTEEVDIALSIADQIEFAWKMIGHPPSCPIIFQPEGGLLEDGVYEYLHRVKVLQNHVTALVSDYDLRVLPQLHILLHGREERSI